MGLCKIMGILNVTPDSFYDGGRYFDRGLAVERAFRIRDEGADMIDIGGESSRPGSKSITAEEETGRVCPVIEAIAGDIGIPISVDTYKPEVARAALEAGASIVNVIGGFLLDEETASVAASLGAGVVLMHMQGRPRTMQDDPRYNDLIGEIRGFLKDAAVRAVRTGIEPARIIIDPGIGFGKTMEDNYRIINNLREFKTLGFPVLVGLSRKSLIGKLYDRESDRLPATIALNVVSVVNGADIIRVHDVKEHRLALAGLEMLHRVS